MFIGRMGFRSGNGYTKAIDCRRRRNRSLHPHEQSLRFDDAGTSTIVFISIAGLPVKAGA
ncbi:hypothetical protein [Paraburkholderia mimosarum]|uniref:hypothetical protein n=1 Tax=Paraburkholderia mimosarum TaxID=312026 RepID=UPI001378FBD4|nr:hypothetical protein [Paraburkholderia mimosarum]